MVEQTVHSDLRQNDLNGTSQFIKVETSVSGDLGQNNNSKCEREGLEENNESCNYVWFGALTKRQNAETEDFSWE